MEMRTLLLFVSLLALIVVGMFTFTYLKRGEQVPSAPVISPIATTSDAEVRRVDAKQYFINGQHTFVGIVDMPTPCDLLTAEARVLESFPEQIVIDFTVVNNAESCVQMITPQRFQVRAAASKEAQVRATWNDLPVELNLLPASEGEVPEDFELFIKG